MLQTARAASRREWHWRNATRCHLGTALHVERDRYGLAAGLVCSHFPIDVLADGFAAG